MSNHLKAESSPYLLQHAENPVDWYPWGEEAFERARLENKPVLLSVGYSACHWCHVMAHESFENPEIAKLMNSLFINIKVDREERPDLDGIYMAAVQAMSGQGGWPLTAFLTPDARPFYGGTYFPPEDRRGMPAFPRVLEHVAASYKERPDELERITSEVLSHIQGLQAAAPREEILKESTLTAAVKDLARRHDPAWGGFGPAPKFPPSMSLELLLRRHHRFDDPSALEMAETTLDRMAAGGLFDQLGGGFHRYSVDARWHVPHFEKMLYDNALLARIYLLAFQVTGKPAYRRVAESTLDYVAREMKAPAGGFYASQDADSEGLEGIYFVWSRKEVLALLGPEDGPLFAAAFDVTEEGNFEGLNVLWAPRALSEVAAEQQVSSERLEAAIASGRLKLLEARNRRVRPATDTKILTAWNGLMLGSFALASRVLDRQDYLAVAESNADFLMEALWHDGRLLRSHRDGESKLDGYLEDYSHLMDGVLELYEANFQPRWLEAALKLAEVANAEFWDAETQAFYDTGKSHEKLVIRPRDAFDNATPSGQSVMAGALLRLAHLTGKEAFRARALAALASAGEQMARYPTGMGRMLTALDFALAPVQELALVGDSASEAWGALKSEIFGPYHPYVVVAGQAPGMEESAAWPLLRDRIAPPGQALAFVCQDATCQPPVCEAATLRQALRVRPERE